LISIARQISKAANRRILAAILIGVGLIILYNFDPTHYFWIPKCPFKLITGLQCPGCGGQRAVFSMLHGHFAEALSYNYWLVFAGPYAFLFIVKRFVLAGAAKEKLGAIIENKYIVWLYIITFVIWMILRNILEI
jgi:hypothetical protein